MGARTGLVSHVLRLADEYAPAIIILENVADFQYRGMSDLLAAFSGLGYASTWSIVSAEEAGAPHKRRRWFCLSVRHGCSATACTFSQLLATTMLDIVTNWSCDFPPGERVVHTDTPARVERCMVLGNAVVPQAVRHALFLLTDQQSPYKRNPPLTLVFAVPGVAPFARIRWGTPLAAYQEWSGRGSQTNYSQRHIEKFKTKLLYEVKTPPGKDLMPAPAFVEWLMGFPLGYTASIGFGGELAKGRGRGRQADCVTQEAPILIA